MEPPFVIQVLSRVDGAKTIHDGKYVKEYNPNTNFGKLMLVTTTDPDDAKQFQTPFALHDFLHQVSRKQPRRPDGKPNKPIWILNTSISNVADARKEANKKVH